MNQKIKKWLEKDGANFLKKIGVNKGHTVLDFGCGQGHHTIPAAKAVENNGKIYALDKDNNEIQNLKTLVKDYNLKNVEIIISDSDIPLEDNSVDVVLCYDVLHYQKNEKRNIIYSNIHRILKNNGIFSVYPKHHKNDNPLMELANIGIDNLIEEIEKSGFEITLKMLKTLLHDDYYNEGYILNFRKI